MRSARLATARATAARIGAVALGAAVLLGGSQVAAQSSYVTVATEGSISVNCSEPSCDCFVNGAPDICPATHVHEYDSGHVTAPSSDSRLFSATGTLAPAFDSSGSASLEAQGTASFGMLRALAIGHVEAGGSYVDGGGLALPGVVTSYVSLGMADVLRVIGAVPGGAVALSFSHQVITAESVSIGGGGLAIDPCLANGEATTYLDALLGAFVVAPVAGDGDNVAYGRTTDTCGAPFVIGSPVLSFTLNAKDGDVVNIAQRLIIDAHARVDGGLGTNPHRALTADSMHDASHTAHVYIEVLTPGASYTTDSGVVYPAPEAAQGLLGVVAGVVLAGLRGVRRSHRRSEISAP